MLDTKGYAPFHAPRPDKFLQQQQNRIVILSVQMSLKDVYYHTSPSSSANRGPTSSSVWGLPAGASIWSLSRI
jgi:hypothetical protein